MPDLIGTLVDCCFVIIQFLGLLMQLKESKCNVFIFEK